MKCPWRTRLSEGKLIFPRTWLVLSMRTWSRMWTWNVRRWSNSSTRCGEPSLLSDSKATSLRKNMILRKTSSKNSWQRSMILFCRTSREVEACIKMEGSGRARLFLSTTLHRLLECTSLTSIWWSLLQLLWSLEPQRGLKSSRMTTWLTAYWSREEKKVWTVQSARTVWKSLPRQLTLPWTQPSEIQRRRRPWWILR